MNEGADFALSGSEILLPAVIATIVSIVVGFIFRHFENRNSAELSHRYEQKKKIKNSIGSHLGRLLGAAEALENRFTNLSSNHVRDWLKVASPASSSDYYFVSTLRRFLNFYEVVYQIEKEAISLDARHADSRDYEFLNYVGLFLWVMKDIDTLFKGVQYDNSEQRDHLYADGLRDFCSRFEKVGDRDSGSEAMKTFLNATENEPLLNFFKGLSGTEKRHRWDRTISLHLVLTAFLDSFGHNRHKKSEVDLDPILQRFNDFRVVAGIDQCIRIFDLHDTQTGRKVSTATERAFRNRTGAFLR